MGATTSRRSTVATGDELSAHLATQLDQQSQKSDRHSATIQLTPRTTKSEEFTRIHDSVSEPLGDGVSQLSPRKGRKRSESSRATSRQLSSSQLEHANRDIKQLVKSVDITTTPRRSPKTLQMVTPRVRPSDTIITELLAGINRHLDLVPIDYPQPPPQQVVVHDRKLITFEYHPTNPGNLVVNSKLDYFTQTAIIGVWILPCPVDVSTIQSLAATAKTTRHSKAAAFVIDITTIDQWIYHIINNYTGPILFDLPGPCFYSINRPIRGQDGFVDSVVVTPVLKTKVIKMSPSTWILIKRLLD